MKKLTWILMIVMVLIVSGCSSAIEGLRFAPGQPTRQQGTQAAQLAAAGLVVPYEPGSAASEALAEGTGAVQGYIGMPDNPLTVDAMIKAAAQKHEARIRNEVRKEIVGTWLNKGSLHITQQMAALAQRLSTLKKTRVKTAEVIRDIQAINATAQALFDAAGAIQMEDTDAQTAELKQAIVDALEAAGISADAARVEANKRPTGEDVMDAADSGIASIGDAVERYWPGGLGVLGPLAGVFYGAKKRKQAKESKADADVAKHDAASAGREAVMEKNAASALRGANESLSTAVAQAQDLLAQAPPKNG